MPAKKNSKQTRRLLVCKFPFPFTNPYLDSICNIACCAVIWKLFNVFGVWYLKLILNASLSWLAAYCDKDASPPLAIKSKLVLRAATISSFLIGLHLRITFSTKGSVFGSLCNIASSQRKQFWTSTVRSFKVQHYKHLRRHSNKLSCFENCNYLWVFQATKFLKKASFSIFFGILVYVLKFKLI